MAKVILDTNILIEILKDNKITISQVNKFDELYISEITEMELYYGAFNKQELLKLKKFISFFNVISVNDDISNKAKDLIFEYSKSHNLAIPDALICATALIKNYKLFTYNLKDFRYIENIKLV